MIDNSIAAGAASIALSIDWNGGDPRIGVLDDGHGMSREDLEEAMRFGGAGPNATRRPGDLGRFGLGLKTSSLSQCRRLTVISRQSDVESRLSWDVDAVIDSRRWLALRDVEIAAFDHVSMPASDGTLVVLERMDEYGGLFGLDAERFFARISDIRAHFAMVFHRFLNGDGRRIRIIVNGREVHGWDPMLRTHPATRMLGTGTIGAGSQTLRVTSYVLPHRDRFSNETEFNAAGGPGGWAERQGFYVYRDNRLVLAGSWLGLGDRRDWTKDESSRLARIAIDLPTGADASWHIDIKKAQARPPAVLRSRLLRLGEDCRERAREVFAWRGGQVRTRSEVRQMSPVWSEEHLSGRRRYRVNREHPLIRSLLESDGETARLFRSALSLIERSVPVERIWLDLSEDVEATQGAIPQNDELVADLVTAVRRTRGPDTMEGVVDGLLRTMRIEDQELRARVLTALDTPR